jgi:tetratricopeptide (TPR) repeat protein
MRRDEEIVGQAHRLPLLMMASGALALQILFFCGCATPQQKTARQQERYSAAKQSFDNTTKLYHLPSADAKGAERDKLLAQAAAGYEQLLGQFPEQSNWCAQSLRSLGNVRASQGRLTEAVKLYASVAEHYPHEDWEILQAWKSAADLLWDAGREAEAKQFYTQIVTRFDVADAPAIVKTIVRGSRSRL